MLVFITSRALLIIDCGPLDPSRESKQMMFIQNNIRRLPVG